MFDFVPEHDQIDIDAYRTFVDTNFDDRPGGGAPPPGVIACHAGNVHDFFRSCSFCPERKYVLVSGWSDWGVHYQSEDHPNKDLRKWADYIKWDEISSIRDEYAYIQIGSTCHKSDCKLEDPYSVKSHTITRSTFQRVPDNVAHWFCANLNVVLPRVEWIPFGLNSKCRVSRKHYERPKEKLLYVNFQVNTNERLRLKNYFRKQSWVTFVEAADVPGEQYLADLSRHRFVLCPEGNGLDCHRTYETLYAGCIPVMRRTRFTERLPNCGIPVLLVDAYEQLTEILLEEAWVLARGVPFSVDYLRLSYWRKKFEKARELL